MSQDEPKPAAILQARDQIFSTLLDVLVSAKEVLGPHAYVSLSFTVAPSREIELVWEMGVQKENFSRDEKAGSGVTWESRDLWGRGASAEEALLQADTAKNSKAPMRFGGRR